MTDEGIVLDYDESKFDVDAACSMQRANRFNVCMYSLVKLLENVAVTGLHAGGHKCPILAKPGVANKFRVTHLSNKLCSVNVI